MKKWTILIALILAVVCLTGCQKNGAGDSSGNGSSEQVTKRDAAPFKVVGNVVSFGKYEQDNNTGNGAEPIKWIVLDVKDGKALLLSEYAIDTKPYNTEWTQMTWEECSLRSWLNSGFMDAAFSGAEQRAILLTDVDNGEEQCYYGFLGEGGKNTKDRVFLLSYHEAYDLYLSSDTARECVPTDYAIANGGWTSSVVELDGRPTGSWWLRSPGTHSLNGAIVTCSGDIHYASVSATDTLIRPAIWVDLNADIF